MKRQFTLEHWRDHGWYVGRLREVPGIFSQGQTLKDLEANIRDAYELMREDSQAAPVRPQTKKIGLEVEVP